ncbi:NAD(P) transhydrogenase subunit beta [Pirellulimonas nuda]|uniref:NAD(P) transhydrogenase subunit beta n=1 Tax=Pirellulimonas nuda TaxID=2528009 RepID=A0A518DJ16_9BACT|nr:NAD(P)(+) transhydrogenase (Re/Si-specific) subunit beta [Pirellulimonas nuda]QDU91460.1 NAD(P) transhydrogenase subunit beta [Pirellulimonas nuda]
MTPFQLQLANLGYLVAAVLFILGVKGMTHPRTAVRGNLLGALGMLVAVVVTVVRLDLVPIGVAAGGMALGAVIGYVMAVRVQMTQMPQLVGLFNGFGGLASVLVAGAEVTRLPTESAPEAGAIVATLAAALAGLIGAVTFTGSMVAAGKLEELPAFKKPWAPPGGLVLNALLLLICLSLAGWMLWGAAWPFWAMVGVACLLGVLVTTPIGGADMPVVVALLNSYSGLAAAAAGFAINNNVLIVAGSLVGASGLILTQIMCKAMNRSLAGVLFAKLEPAADGPSADDVYAGKIKATSADEVAMLLDGAQRVVIVPGYGLAVAQAQHAVRELASELARRGATVEYGIHPVAGRMPGHMNVLLAEADVPYDQLQEMEAINPTFAQCDVAIVIGANDVVNPVANTDPNSPIAGMPILNVGDARTVVVIKRSLSPGFAGIPNPLFAADNCLMLFGDGKQALLDLVTAVKEN